MSTHQETVGPLISTLLDHEMFERSEPGSAIFVEVYKNMTNGEFKILMFYKKSADDLSILQMLTTEQLVKRFTAKVGQLREMTNSVDELCAMTFDEFTTKLGGAPELMSADYFMAGVAKAHNASDLYQDYKQFISNPNSD